MMPRLRMLLLAVLLCTTVGVLDHASTAAGVSSGTQASSVTAPPSVATGLVTAISAGYDHSCALKDGGAWCWGRNDHGELGNNSTTNSAVAVPVWGLDVGVSAISAGGYHSCALKDNSVWCWGDNESGELGNNTTTNSTVPVLVSALASGVTAISAGFLHTCALKDRGVWCWGAGWYGQLGNNSVADSPLPVAVSDMATGVTAISAGYLHSCAVKDGAAWCWGNNNNVELGNDSTTNSDIPVAVLGMTSGVTVIAAASNHTCALNAGVVWCWGWDLYDQLGVYPGGNWNSAAPVVVPGLSSGVSEISSRWLHTCALISGGVWCWGSNEDGELGTNSSNMGSPVTTTVSRMASDATAISAGYRHTCAIQDGSAWCWGRNDYGQLGNISTTDSFVPVPVAGMEVVRQQYIAAGDSIPAGADTGTGDCQHDPHNPPPCPGNAAAAYPADLAGQYYASIGASFAVSNISCSGDSSLAFLTGDTCQSQQGRASQYLYLLTHPADLITITVGADDYVLPAAKKCIQQTQTAKNLQALAKCSKDALKSEQTPLKQTAANLNQILKSVVVAQPTASIVVTGYYDPLPQSVAPLPCTTFDAASCNWLNSDIVSPFNEFLRNANRGITDLNAAISTVVGAYSAQTAGRVRFAPIYQQFIGHCSTVRLQGAVFGFTLYQQDLGCAASATWIAPTAPLTVLSASTGSNSATLTIQSGVHPNEAGHACIASVVLQRIVPASPSRCN